MDSTISKELVDLSQQSKGSLKNVMIPEPSPQIIFNFICTSYGAATKEDYAYLHSHPFPEHFFRGCLKKGFRDLLEIKCITGKKQRWNGPFKVVFLNISAIDTCNVP